jgi:hypothetical protein
MRQFTKDTSIKVEVYHFDDYKSSPRQYEMHHLNSDVKISTSLQERKFKRGDYYIRLNQEANRFLIETLEPQAEDSYFTGIFLMPSWDRKRAYQNMYLKKLLSII